VPANLSIQTATREHAIAAFTAAASASESLGDYEDSPVIRKKGPYGYYVCWKEQKLNCKAEDTLAEIAPRLQAKADPAAVDHQVGPYRIKKGPYGLYMFKASASNRKPTFVGIPDTTPWATLTPESAEEIYKHCAAAKKQKAKT
jgi:topoisomerase IA-like protein